MAHHILTSNDTHDRFGWHLSPTTKGLVMLFAAIIVWGANWPIMKSGLAHITPLWFSTIRFAMGGLTLFILQMVTRTLYWPTRQDLPLILSVGLLQMLAFTALGAMAMTQIDAGRSAILAYTTPLWVVPASLLIFRESISRNQWIGTLCGMLGVAVLFNPFALDWSDSIQLKANLMLLTGSLCWGICILHIRHSKGNGNAYQLAPWQMLTATVPLTLISYWYEGPFTGDGSIELWQIALFMGPLATAFCFCAVNSASQKLSSTSMSSSMLGVPVVGLLMSVAFLGEVLSISLLIGTVLISSGIIMGSIKR